MMQRRSLVHLLTASCALLAGVPAYSQNIETPDALVKRLSADVIDTIKADPQLRSGNIARISQLVDSVVMPNVNFRRMTSAAVGPMWRQATPEQRERLQQEFKNMLIRTYAGALKQVSNERVVVKPLRVKTIKRSLILTVVRLSEVDMCFMSRCPRAIVLRRSLYMFIRTNLLSRKLLRLRLVSR